MRVPPPWGWLSPPVPLAPPIGFLLVYCFGISMEHFGPRLVARSLVGVPIIVEV